MGYTHYWDHKHLTQKKFAAAAKDCRKVVAHLGIPVQVEHHDPAPAEFEPNWVRFNGVGKGGHETFLIDRLDSKSSCFCKTARKPYDAAVCACLIAFRHHFGEKFTVSSDGRDDEEGWPVARAACQEVLGYGKDFSLEVAGPSPFSDHGLCYSKYPTASAFWQEFYCRDGISLRRLKVPCHGHPLNDVTVRDGDQNVQSFRGIRNAQWFAAYLFLSKKLEESIRAYPGEEVGSFLVSFLAKPGDWTPLHVLADWLEERGDKTARKLRAWLPKEKKR